MIAGRAATLGGGADIERPALWQLESGSWDNGFMNIASVLTAIEERSRQMGVVLGADGELWLSASLSRVRGSAIIDHRAQHVGLVSHNASLAEDGTVICSRTLMGGRLPAGAVAAEVVDDAGCRHQAHTANGVWILVLDQPINGAPSPVCYKDPDGQLIPPQLPANWHRSPLPEVTESCPACGNVIWDSVTAVADLSVGSIESAAPAQLLVCRACGHEDHVGTIVRLFRHTDSTAEPHASRRDMAKRFIVEPQRARLATVAFRIYAARDWPVVLAGTGTSGGTVDSVTVAHGTAADRPGPSLHVRTVLNSRYQLGEETIAQRELERWLLLDAPSVPVDGTNSQIAATWRRHERERRLRVSRAAQREILIFIDGQREPFTSLHLERRFVAVRRRREHTIVLAAIDVDPQKLVLQPLGDPVEQLAPLGPNVKEP